MRTSLVTLALVLSTPSRTNADEFDDQKDKYFRYLKRPSLQMRVRGRVWLAQTRDPRALAILAKDYATATDPKDHEPYLIASICARECREARFVDAFDRWRLRHRKPRDAWLWYKALDVHLAGNGPEEVQRTAQRDKNVFFRAAALRVLAERHGESACALIPGLLTKPPGKPLDAGIVVEACAVALHAARKEFGTDGFRAAALALIRCLGGKATPDRSKLTIARNLGRILESERLTFDTDYWRKLLAYREESDRESQDTRYAGPRRPEFVGVPASGSRLCYVLDASDSMLIELTESLRRKMRTPVTGRRNTDKVTELPWHRIKTRFDAAREYLKHSLRALDKSQRFAVVLFGTNAETLAVTSSLKQASKSNVGRACRELDRIQGGPKTRNRPYGALKGDTNMHGGLRKAFKLTARREAGPWEYVDKKALLTGCDTIYLLSDGVPSWDDWPTLDQREPEDLIGQPESGVPGPETEVLNYCGPYRDMWFLVDDLKRLNLFRHVEIHCIGLGEASQILLKEIAAVGGGKVRLLGK